MVTLLKLLVFGNLILSAFNFWLSTSEFKVWYYCIHMKCKQCLIFSLLCNGEHYLKSKQTTNGRTFLKQTGQ